MQRNNTAGAAVISFQASERNNVNASNASTRVLIDAPLVSASTTASRTLIHRSNTASVFDKVGLPRRARARARAISRDAAGIRRETQAGYSPRRFPRDKIREKARCVTRAGGTAREDPQRRERIASSDVGASYAAENKMQLTTMAESVH